MEKQTVLVVDDSIDLIEALEEMLILKGYGALTASCGLDGVSLALTKHPDLIILDLRMPDIDGYEVVKRIRKDDWGKTARILILTASGESDEIPHDIELDREDFLLKTEWGLDKLAGKIAEKLAEPAAVDTVSEASLGATEKNVSTGD